MNLKYNNQPTSNVSERLQEFINYLKIRNNQFAMNIDVNESRISNIVNGRNKPSFELIQKILSYYRYLDPIWLILGEGEMLNEDKLDYPEEILLNEQQPNYPLIEKIKDLNERLKLLSELKDEKEKRIKDLEGSTSHNIDKTKQVG